MSACNALPPDQIPSDQTAHGTASRPILSANEAKNFVAARYFASRRPNTAPWPPSPITLPAQPDFVVGPAGTPGVTHTSIQAAVDAALIKRTNKRQYIAIMPGGRQGTVYVHSAPGSLTLYGTGEKPIDVKIGMAIDGEMSVTDWRHGESRQVQSKPARETMFDNCQSKHARSDRCNVFCRVPGRRITVCSYKI